MNRRRNQRRRMLSIQVAPNMRLPSMRSATRTSKDQPEGSRTAAPSDGAYEVA
ncbi:hypothetical protein ACFDTO_28940 [Microbacteriaceae bacterium 4G12]